MEDALPFITQYKDEMIAISTIGMFLTGLGTLVITAALFLENFRLRRANTDPEIVAYLAPDLTHVNILYFCLKNVGKGYAKNITFHSDASTESWEKKGMRVPFDPERPAIGGLPQDEIFKVYFGSGLSLLQQPTPPPVRIRIEYENIRGKKFRRAAVLDVNQFKGFSWVNPDPNNKAARALQNIEQHLRDLSTGFRRLHVESATPEMWRQIHEREDAAWLKGVPHQERTDSESEK